MGLVTGRKQIFLCCGSMEGADLCICSIVLPLFILDGGEKNEV